MISFLPLRIWDAERPARQNRIGSLPDQQADSRSDGENRRHKAELPKRDPKGTDDADDNQINREEEHSDVLFHWVQFRIVTVVPICAAL